MNKFLKIKAFCLKIMEVITCAALLCLLGVLLLQIVSRMLKMPFPGTMTYATMLLMWVAFPAACLGLEKKMQLGVDLLYNLLSVRNRGFLDIIAGLSIALFAVLAMCCGGSCIAFFLLENREIVRFMFYLPLILSGVVMIMQGADRIIAGVRAVAFAGKLEE